MENTALTEITNLKKQKIAEAIIKFNEQEKNALKESREDIFKGIANLAPLMGEIKEETDHEEMDVFFFTLKKINKLFAELIEIEEA